MIGKSETKSVVISIKPKWCDLIASGKKTIEIRKNRPKMETPFKCYIYCTHGYYRTPKELSEFGLTRPPQSWCYPFPGQRTKKQL